VAQLEQSGAQHRQRVGHAVLKQLRALRSQVPVVVASGSAKAEAEVLSHGAFAFVLKPIDLSELGRVVAAASAITRRPAV
jgi:FixJ family two-component response regulator